MTEEGDKAAAEVGEAVAPVQAAEQAAAVVWAEIGPGPDPAGSADAPSAARQCPIR